MTRSRKILALVGAVLVLALAGCVRFQADLSVTPENTLDGDIVVAVIANDDDPGSQQNAQDAAADIEARLLPGLRGSDGVTAKPYEQDDYVGTRFTLDDTPIDALSGGGSEGALSLTRTGDVFEFSGTLDFTPDDQAAAQPDPGDGGIQVAISFPGEVLEHNGELEGSKVTWSTSLEGSVDMHARASAIPSGPPAWVWLAAGAALLVVVAVIVVVVGVARRRRASIPA